MKSTDIEYAKHFSANVKYLIALKGKQQQEIATELGYKPTTFYNWCAGRIFPSFRDLQRIAEYFHVNPEDLVHPLVGGEVMFNERLSAEEMKMLEAFRAASDGNKAAALHILVRGTRSAALGQASRLGSRAPAWHYPSLASKQKKIKK